MQPVLALNYLSSCLTLQSGPGMCPHTQLIQLFGKYVYCSGFSGKKKKWRTRWKVALIHILEHFTSKPGVSAPTQSLHLKGSPCCVSDIIKTESCEHHLLSTNVDSPWEPLKLEMNKPLMSGLRKEMYKMRLGQLNSRKLAKASEVTSKGFWNKLEETFTECLGKSELRHGK